MQNVNFDHQREQLVETELRMLGIRDPAVLQAMRAVPREEFVAEPIKQVRAAHPDSYEGLMHLAEMDAFFLPLSKSKNRQLISALTSRRLERAIGVIYHPETERLSHYFDASLPGQFDEWLWFDETSAVRPLTTQQIAEHEPPHPFAVMDR